jgi:hypothetical protein
MPSHVVFLPQPPNTFGQRTTITHSAPRRPRARQTAHVQTAYSLRFLSPEHLPKEAAARNPHSYAARLSLPPRRFQFLRLFPGCSGLVAATPARTDRRACPTSTDLVFVPAMAPLSLTQCSCRARMLVRRTLAPLRSLAQSTKRSFVATSSFMADASTAAVPPDGEPATIFDKILAKEIPSTPVSSARCAGKPLPLQGFARFCSNFGASSFRPCVRG